MIHKAAIVHPKAQIGEGTTVGPFAIIEEGVIIGKNCKIEAHAIIREGSILDDSVFVDSFATVGGVPQDRKYDNKIRSGVKIGQGTHIREGVTIHRSTYDGTHTIVGQYCLLMGYCHVAHDCILGDYVNITNGAILGGHVTVGSYGYIAGLSGIQPKVRMGEGVMLAARSSLMKDAPPFLIINDRNEVNGINIVGIKRRGFSREAIMELKQCYQAIFGSPGNPFKKAVECKAAGLGVHELANKFLAFFSEPSILGCVQYRQVKDSTNEPSEEKEDWISSEKY